MLSSQILSAGIEPSIILLYRTEASLRRLLSCCAVVSSISSVSSPGPGIVTLKVMAKKNKAFSAASTIKWPQTARAMALPVVMCTTALEA